MVAGTGSALRNTKGATDGDALVGKMVAGERSALGKEKGVPGWDAQFKTLDLIAGSTGTHTPTYVKQVKVVAGACPALTQLFNAFDLTGAGKRAIPPKGAGPCPAP